MRVRGTGRERGREGGRLGYIIKGVDTGGALGAEAPPDFQALQYIQYTCMEQIVEF